MLEYKTVLSALEFASLDDKTGRYEAYKIYTSQAMIVFYVSGLILRNALLIQFQTVEQSVDISEIQQSCS